MLQHVYCANKYYIHTNWCRPSRGNRRLLNSVTRVHHHDEGNTRTLTYDWTDYWTSTDRAAND